MLKNLWNVGRMFPAGSAQGSSLPANCPDWLRDPLSHPALNAMSLTEIADLPARQLRPHCRD